MLLSIPAAARMLGVKLAEIRDMVASKQIRTVQIANRFMVPAVEVERLLAMGPLMAPERRRMDP